MASRFLNYYNEKKYDEIYSLLSPSFKNEMAAKEFGNFLGNDVFISYSTFEKFNFHKDGSDHSQFLGQFKNGELLIKLNVNDQNQIDLLQLLPYESVPKTKITDYLSDNKKSTSMDSLVDKMVSNYMQSPQNCGLSIALYKDGREYFYNYGEIKRNTKSIPSANTIYEIGSVSKVFCGVLLAKAIAEKKVKATDDIRLYLPEGKYKNLESRDNYIQLIHLANHTSGLPRIPEDIELQPDYDPLNPYKNYNKEMVLNYLQTITLSTEPGKVCEYSNLGMGLLGIILEKVYNRPFEELVKEKICKPLNMTGTAIKLNEAQQPLFATGYNSLGKETPHWELPDITAAGGIRSTPKDMLVFLEQNIEEKDEALKLSHQLTFTTGNTIGMAWHMFKTKQGNTLTWHNGATFGSTTFCGFIKEKNCAVVVLSNSGMAVDPIALSILKFLQQ